MAFKQFGLLPAIAFTPAIVYCDVCGTVVVASKASTHVCTMPPDTPGTTTGTTFIKP